MRLREPVDGPDLPGPLRIDEVDTSNGIAVYCMVGPRARKGEAALIAAGHDRVLHIEGGFTAWKAAGLPTALD